MIICAICLAICVTIQDFVVYLLQLITSREESAAIRQQLRQVEDMDETDWPTYRATLVRQVCSPDETT